MTNYVQDRRSLLSEEKRLIFKQKGIQSVHFTTVRIIPEEYDEQSLLYRTALQQNNLISILVCYHNGICTDAVFLDTDGDESIKVNFNSSNSSFFKEENLIAKVTTLIYKKE